MLLRVSELEIEQRCDGCGAQRVLTCASLTAGMEIGDPPEPTDPNIIALPECGVCRAREFLARGSAPRESGVVPSPHRLAVNALHAQLVASGRQAGSLRAYFELEEVAFERAELPWVAAEGLPPPVGPAGTSDPAAQAFQEFLANRATP